MRIAFSGLTYFLFLMSSVFGQDLKYRNIDSLLSHVSEDKAGVKELLDWSLYYSFFDVQAGRKLAEKARQVSRNIGYPLGEANALNNIGETYHFAGDYPNALKYLFECLDIYREVNDTIGQGSTLGLIGMVHNEMGQYRQALQYLMPAKAMFPDGPGHYSGSFELSNIGDSYLELGMTDSAYYYERRAYASYLSFPIGMHQGSFILRHMGDAYLMKGKTDSALRFYDSSIVHALRTKDLLNMSLTENKIAEVYASMQRFDSVIHYARLALVHAESNSAKLHRMNAAILLSKAYKGMGVSDSALHYLEMSMNLRDSLYGPEKVRGLQWLMLEEQRKQQSLQQQQEHYRNRIRFTALLSGMVVFLLLLFLLWRNNRQKMRSNLLLQDEKRKVEQAYEELQSTQQQLIQSEKMASLGELTAGIAHEIQNPLNFVNNFSDVNKELLQELKEGISKKNYDEVASLADDVISNEEKVNYHGKRADAIVKSMLQHSRKGSAVKDLTDINLLADEFARLAYHGLRAREKNFNAGIETSFDKTLGKINIISQDIGRVFLNIINNAFYAMAEKKKQDPLYAPVLKISTIKMGNQAEIHIADNGPGIPKHALDKIFQPFFTTKPTGEGTGLGLSLSYDIITKGHGGQMKVITEEGRGTEFIISLPFQ